MKNRNRDDGFIIDLWAYIFSLLSKISVYYLIRKIKKKISYTFVEGWVLGHMVGALIASIIGYYINNDKYPFILYFIVGYGMLRVYEIIIYQLNVLFFDPYRAEKKMKTYVIKSPTRLVIMLLHNYIEVMFWYAAIIISLLQLSNQMIEVSWGEYVKSSVICITTFDGGAIQELVGGFYPKLSNIIFLQIITGIIMTIISLARFIGLLPAVDSVKPKDE